MAFRRPRRNLNRPRPKLDLRKDFVRSAPTSSPWAVSFVASTRFASSPKVFSPREIDVYRAAVLLIFAMLFDMMDGRVARMTKTQSALRAPARLSSGRHHLVQGVAPTPHRWLVYKWVLHRDASIPGILTAFMFVSSGAAAISPGQALSTCSARASTGAPSKPATATHLGAAQSTPSAGILISADRRQPRRRRRAGHDERYTLHCCSA